MKKGIAFTLIAGSLAACVKPIPPTFTAADVIASQTTYSTLTALPTTNIAAMPIAGSGTYTGLIAGDLTGGDIGGGSFLGDLTLVVDFASTGITGSARNINVIDEFGEPNQTLGGTLAVVGAVAGNSMTAGASGSVSAVANIPGTSIGVSGSVDMSLLLGGAFRTNIVAADTITGGVTGIGTGDIAFGVTNGTFGVQQ